MTKALALLLIVAVAFASAQDKTSDKVERDVAKGGDKSGSDAGKAKRMAAVGPKDFDVKKLEGKWFNVASSAVITKMLGEACSCNTLEFKRLSDTKYDVIAACQAKEGGKIKSVNGTLTMVRPNENKSLFNLAFTEKKGDIKGVEVDKEERQKVEQAKGKGDDKDKAKNKIEEADKKGKSMEDVNTIVLKVGDNFKDVLMASPSLDAAWILSRDQKFDEKLLENYKNFLNQSGFTTSKLIKIDHSKCAGDVLKGKVAAGGAAGDIHRDQKADQQKLKQ